MSARPSVVVGGVDGGGTRTRALLLGPDGSVLGHGEGPPSLVDPGRPEDVAAVVLAVLDAAAESAAVMLPLDALWVGLAGAGRREIWERVERALERVGPARAVVVGSDAEAALHDAFDGEPGIVLVAGTGSIALGRSSSGALLRAGGWGEPLGDEGSGFWIGMEGLRAVTRASDGRDPETSLTGAILEALGLEDAAELVSWVAGASKADVARVAPLVIREGASDAAAALVVEGAVASLVRLVETVAVRGESQGIPRKVGFAGGLLRSGDPVRVSVSRALELSGFDLALGPVIPQRGAAHLALALLNS